MTSTPVLLITFNRPNQTRQVLEVIRSQQPKQLFVFQDGKRDGIVEDEIKCFQVKKIVNELLDWDCKLYTFYSEINLGCGPGPAAAISWFFKQVESGIVIEDDCILSDTAWIYFDELLVKYKNNDKVGMLVAANLRKKWKSNIQSYHFARMGGSPYGCFATWRDVWNKFDYNIDNWTESKEIIRKNLGNKSYFYKLSEVFDKVSNNKQNDAWDFQWFFCLVKNDYLVVVPSVNMLSNIGFGADATHTVEANDQSANMQIYEIKFPLTEPSSIKIDKLFDWIMFNRFWVGRKSLFRRIVLYIVEKIYCV